jgi:3-dehydroquinate synthetase
MFYDKKKNGDKINFILLNKIGAAYHELLSKKELKDMLTVFLELGGSIDN